MQSYDPDTLPVLWKPIIFGIQDLEASVVDTITDGIYQFHNLLKDFASIHNHQTKNILE